MEPLVEAVLVALAVALALPPRPVLAASGRFRLSVRWAWLGVLVVPLLPVGGRTLALGGIVVGVVAGARRLHVRRRRAADAAAAGARATELCESIAAELGAGAAPNQALASVAEDFPELAPVAHSGRLGGDVPGAFRVLAERPGLDDLRLVAGAWQVSSRSGSGLADSLERVGATLRARRRTGRLVAAELASAWATARIMAALPIVFALAGSGLGADPMGFLLRTTGGVACLAAGLGLTWLGLAWLQRIADSVVAS